MEKAGPRGLLIASYKRLKKRLNRAITPVVEAVHALAHLAPPGSLQAKQLCHLHTQLSLGQSCRSQKKAFRLCVQGLFGSVQFFATLWTMACQASLSGRRVLQARILEPTGQYWLPYPSRTLYFLLSQPPTPLSTWCCQNPCNPSSCSTSTPGPHREKPKSSRAASETNPSGRPTCRGGNKTTIETQRQCG